MAEPDMAVSIARRAAFVALAVVVGLVLVIRATRADAPAFVVEGVEVDRTAASATLAREAALAEGQQMAFRRLLERLTLRADHPRLPELSAAGVADLIENFEVQAERSSSVRYIATLTFRFNPEGVRAVLRRAGIPFAETRARPMVILPVFRRGDGAVLWDAPNPWFDVWRGVPARDGLQPLVIPLGDLGDIGAISAEQAMQGAVDRIDAIARRYDAGGAIVVEALLDGPADRRTTVEVATTRFDGAAAEQTVVESYVARPDEDEAALLARAAVETARLIEERWKSDVVLQFGKQAVLTANVSFAGVEDWVMLRRRLAEAAVIRKADILSLSRGRAQVELHYIGTESGLRLALAQKDLLLERDGAGWELRLRPTSGEGQAPSRP
ncbi:MAG TPA: DUF2066 domain-containing protein [Alphaproteobacteria bacterium]